MMQLTQHIEVIRQKPEHIRKQIALSIAVALTGVIALVWLGASLATGAFAINTKPVEGTPELAVTPASVGGLSSLLGAVGAAFGGEASGPVRIEVVETASSGAAAQKKSDTAEPTILPF